MSNRFHRLAAVPTRSTMLAIYIGNNLAFAAHSRTTDSCTSRPPGAVDDRKTAMSQADVPIDPDATRIRTAAGHCFRHRSDEVLVRAEIAILANPASYSADRVILRVRFPCQHAAYPVQRVNFLDQRRSARGRERHPWPVLQTSAYPLTAAE